MAKYVVAHSGEGAEHARLLPVADATEPEQVIAAIGRWADAEKIIRDLADMHPLVNDGGNYADYCALCGHDVPWGEISRHPTGLTVCPRHPDDKGRYPEGSTSYCGEARVAVTEARHGHLTGPEHHHASCAGRMAQEWVAGMDGARNA